MKNILLIILIITLSVFAENKYKIENAKIGSNVINNFGSFGTRFGRTVDGHSAIIINEYEDNFDLHFIIAMDGNTVSYQSYASNFYSYSYLGHFRAVNRNYTFKERKTIKKIAKKAIEADTDYEFLNLYIYDWDSNHKNNTPYSNVIPTDFRCDGFAEWTTEIGLNPTNPKEEDGFYTINTAFHRPISITEDPVDKIGIPDKPILSLVDDGVKIEFPKVSGAWSEALYAVYKKDSSDNNISKDNIIYCGSNDSNSYIDEKKENSTQYYFLKVGERTADCDKMSDFSELSEPTTISRFFVDDINKTILDQNTSLMWNNTDLETESEILNWSNSNDICNELQLSSYENWRMPSFSELNSIVDPISV